MIDHLRHTHPDRPAAAPAPSVRPDDASGVTPGARAVLPAGGWIVGSSPITAAARPDAGRRRSARLEARLAVYAQYAAVVAEQAEATLVGDDARMQRLAEHRVAVAEHFDELQAGTGAPSAPVEPEMGFGLLLGEALAELEHQAAVDVALQQRLVGLRDAVLRGAAWGAACAQGATGEGRPAGSGVAALPALPPGGGDVVLTGELANALVSARAGGAGGALGGHFPGRAPADPAVPHAASGGRVDVRF